MNYSGDDTDQYCKDCRRITQTVLDHRQGDTICSECGLVLEAYFVDTTAEWRTFADSENNPTRTGKPVNPLLSDAVLGTKISVDTKNNSINNSRSLGRVNTIVEKHTDSSLNDAFESIVEKDEDLGITSTAVISQAQQIYKDADHKNKKLFKGKNKHAWPLACLILAGQPETSGGRTFKEITNHGKTTYTATKKEINKICQQLKTLLGIDSKAIDTEALKRRCCFNLDMGQRETNAVYETIENLNKAPEIYIRRNPSSIRAGVSYMFVKLLNNGKTIEDVSQVFGVAVATTKKAYRDLYPHAEQIIPSWFAKPEDIKKLRIP